MSFADVIHSGFAYSDAFVLAHQDGLLVYREPAIEPLTQQPVERDVRDVILEFCRAKGVNIFEFTGPKYDGLKLLSELSKEEEIELSRGFMIKSGMVVKEAKWDDPEGLAPIMDIINLKTPEKSILY